MLLSAFFFLHQAAPLFALGTFLTLSVLLNKGNNDHSSHSVGWETKWVNLCNHLAQFPAHGKYVVQVRDDDDGDEDGDNDGDDEDFFPIRRILRSCKCHASVARTDLVNFLRTIVIPVF